MPLLPSLLDHRRILTE